MHIYKTPAGTWAYRVDIGMNPATGRRRQKSKAGFSRKKDAEAAARELLTEVQRQSYVEESSLTFSQFSREWLERYRVTVKESTYKARVPDVKALTGEMGAVPIQKINLRLYQNVINKLYKRYAMSTLRLVHNTAQMIFKDARRYEVIAKDPTEFAVLPKAPDVIAEKLPAFLDREQLTEFLDACKQRPEQDYTMFLLLAYTGLRIGEAMALCWEDVDFNNSTLRVNKTLFRTGKEFKLTTPKTRRSKRVIDLPAVVIKTLKAHRREQAEQRLAAGRYWHKPENFIFTTPTTPGAPTNITFWRKHIEAVLKLCPGLPKIHPHSFRHTHASLLAEAGIPLEEIVDRLGHSTDGITRRIYLHVTEGRRKQVAEKFARFMGQ